MRLRLIFGVALSILTAAFSVAGCASERRASMTYEECAKARRCTVHGIVTARPAEHAWMGELKLADGRCISVSLPLSKLNSLRQSGPVEMTVSGRVYGDPSADREIASMEIAGRQIGLGLCGNFFVLVPD
jgi:hypothetical protein